MISIFIQKFQITKFDFSLQGKENVASLQVSVDDVVLVQVDQSLQGLLAHHADLRLSQRPLQFCQRTRMAIGESFLFHITLWLCHGVQFGKRASQHQLRW